MDFDNNLIRANELFGLKTIESYREGNRLEVKRAKDGLPHSIWETYSAFANTEGGVILLGVDERPDKSLDVLGLENPQKLETDFWNLINNPNKVSANILTNSDVQILHVEDREILSISVPRASRDNRPLYLNKDVFSGAYRRNGEGDYHCSKDECLAMIRDQSGEGMDRSIVDTHGLDSLSEDTIMKYRNEFNIARKGHPWSRLNNEEFLMRLNAIKRSSDGLLHPTRAGLLMFGFAYRIADEFPYYFLDYREVHPGDDRWSNRITSDSGEWSGNIYDFFYKVVPHLTSGFSRPFVLDSTMRRIDDTAMHKALREALVNALGHADYLLPRHVVIIKSEEMIEFANPGSLRISAEVAFRGGISDTRNPLIMTMFNLISIGEKAGSGFDIMRRACDEMGLPYPMLEESFNPDRTRLTFKLNAQTKTKEAAKREESSGNDKGLTVQEESVYQLFNQNGSIARKSVEDSLGVGKTRAALILKSLEDKGVIRPVGEGRARRYCPAH